MSLSVGSDIARLVYSLTTVPSVLVRGDERELAESTQAKAHSTTTLIHRCHVVTTESLAFELESSDFGGENEESLGKWNLLQSPGPLVDRLSVIILTYECSL
jgi:hypothetical protein